MQRDDIIVFLGPTLPLAEARRLLDADYRMPANRGDVYQASKSGPQIILLIDGAFESEVAVLHNELLWALNKGIIVIGAASMGALRAAELASFGMIGVGKIFQDYKDGMLERDDAVAVVHGPAELGYPLLSTALVDIWATLDRASEFGVLSVDDRDMLRDLAAGIFYKRLSMETLIETAVQVRLAKEQAEILRRYVNTHGIFSQKGEDAVQVLRLISGELALSSVQTTPSDFIFERTLAWEKLCIEQNRQDKEMVAQDRVSNIELELAAIGLGLIEMEALRRGYVITRNAEFQDAARSFRRKYKLGKFSDVQRWMEAASFEHSDYLTLIEDDFYIEHSRALTGERFEDLVYRVKLRRRNALSKLQIQAEHD